MTTHEIMFPKALDTRTSDVYDFEAYATSLVDQDEKENEL